MVLLACYECGNDVSSSAASCPTCGAPFEPANSAPSAPPPLHEPVAESPSPQLQVAQAPRSEKRRHIRNTLVCLAFVGGIIAFAAMKDSTPGVMLMLFAMVLLGVGKPKAKGPRKGNRPKVVCKFCQAAGFVSAHRAERKRGISGGKATGALLTGGLSLLATGLSRKEVVSSMRCENCGMKWDE